MATFDDEYMPGPEPIGYCATLAALGSGKVLERSQITNENRARTIARRWTKEIPNGRVYVETLYAVPLDEEGNPHAAQT